MRGFRQSGRPAIFHRFPGRSWVKRKGRIYIRVADRPNEPGKIPERVVTVLFRCWVFLFRSASTHID